MNDSNGQVLDETQMEHIREILKRQDDLMVTVFKRHREETGHRVWKGANFVDCHGCTFHAHVTHTGNDVYMVKHNATYTVTEIIRE